MKNNHETIKEIAEIFYKLKRKEREVVSKKANLRDIDPTLKRVQERLITRVDRLSSQLESGAIDVDEWHRKMGELVAEGAGIAYKAGAGTRRVTDEAARPLSQFVSEQLAFLDNFKNDIDNTGWLAKYISRAQMYATATTTTFSLGDVVKQAGRVLALPSMPAEGTICHTNCGCEWEIVTINFDNVDYDAYWRLGKDDNCQTCVQRARDWSPVQIREGVLQP